MRNPEKSGLVHVRIIYIYIRISDHAQPWDPGYISIGTINFTVKSRCPYQERIKQYEYRAGLPDLTARERGRGREKARSINYLLWLVAILCCV